MLHVLYSDFLNEPFNYSSFNSITTSVTDKRLIPPVFKLLGVDKLDWMI